MNVPALAVACGGLLLKELPEVIVASAAEVIVGAAWFTTSGTVRVGGGQTAVSVGTEVVDSVWLPAVGWSPSTDPVSMGTDVVDGIWLPAVETVPAAAVSTALAVVSTWILLKGVPSVIAAGAGDAIVGVAWATVSGTVSVTGV